MKVTGKQLRKIRKEFGEGVKKFYEGKLGYTYYTIGLNAEKMYEVPEDCVNKLINAGFIKNGETK